MKLNGQTVGGLTCRCIHHIISSYSISFQTTLDDIKCSDRVNDQTFRWRRNIYVHLSSNKIFTQTIADHGFNLVFPGKSSENTAIGDTDMKGNTGPRKERILDWPEASYSSRWCPLLTYSWKITI